MSRGAVHVPSHLGCQIRDLLQEHGDGEPTKVRERCSISESDCQSAAPKLGFDCTSLESGNSGSVRTWLQHLGSGEGGPIERNKRAETQQRKERPIGKADGPRVRCKYLYKYL